MGAAYAHQNRIIGKTEWQFEGQEIFKKAVHGMAMACDEALTKIGKTAADVDLVIPHQANLRIIEAASKRVNLPMERVFVNVDRYGNTGAASVYVALAEAVSSGRLKRGDLVMLAAFGGGFAWGAALMRW
jgi:3-oxoacyl-[acyl-carrier-protein] synthase-3